jgi:hypothetical protein
MLIRTEAIETSIPEVYTRSPASVARVNTARTINPGQMIVEPELPSKQLTGDCQTPSYIGTNFAAIRDTFSKLHKHGFQRDVFDFSLYVIVPRQGRYRIQFHRVCSCCSLLTPMEWSV